MSTEFIDASLHQKEATVEKTVFTEMLNAFSQEYEKVNCRNVHSPSDYTKVILLDYEDDAVGAIFMCYIGSSTALFKGLKGEEFD